jgi:hypothetical protein
LDAKILKTSNFDFSKELLNHASVLVHPDLKNLEFTAHA